MVWGGLALKHKDKFSRKYQKIIPITSSNLPLGTYYLYN